MPYGRYSPAVYPPSIGPAIQFIVSGEEQEPAVASTFKSCRSARLYMADTAYIRRTEPKETELTTTHTALDAYMAAHADAVALLERIADAIDNHDTAPAPEDIHWGHVGDMVETRRQLQEISDRLFANGQYAPASR